MSEDRTILIVDDEDDLRLVVGNRLKHHGFHVLEANNAASALEIARVRHPALILMDIMMPGMDGVEATRMLHEDAATKDIPIVMLTAKSDLESNLTSLLHGALDFLAKPVDMPQLMAVLDRHLGPSSRSG